jgi:hypothetical protein
LREGAASIRRTTSSGVSTWRSFFGSFASAIISNASRRPMVTL